MFNGNRTKDILFAYVRSVRVSSVKRMVRVQAVLVFLSKPLIAQVSDCSLYDVLI